MSFKDKINKYCNNKVRREYVDLELSEEEVYTSLMCVLDKSNHLACLTEVKKEIELQKKAPRISLEQTPLIETAIILYNGLAESRVNNVSTCYYHMPIRNINVIIENAMVKLPNGKLNDACEYKKLSKDEEVKYTYKEQNNYNLLMYLLKKQEKPKIVMEEIPLTRNK